MCRQVLKTRAQQTVVRPARTIRCHMAQVRPAQLMLSHMTKVLPARITRPHMAKVAKESQAAVSNNNKQHKKQVIAAWKGL